MNKNQIEPTVETYLDTGWRFVVLAAFGAALLGALLVLLGGCATGAAAPPRAWESRFFTIVTNQVPVVHTFTNTVTNVVVQTEVRNVPVIVLVTNTQGVTVTATNFVTVTKESTVFSYATNTVTLTNTVPDYEYTPNKTAAAVKDAGGAVGGLFGVGGLATTLIGGLFGIYGTMRSSKNGKAAAAAVQGVEMAREVLKTTPQGQALDAELVKQLMAHQAQAGVIQHIAELIGEHVDESDAKVVADEIAAIIRERTTHAVGAPLGTPKV